MKRFTSLTMACLLLSASPALASIPSSLTYVVGGKYGDGGPAIEAAAGAWGMVATEDELFIADLDGHEIRRIANGRIDRLAGTGRNEVGPDGYGPTNSLSGPYGIVKYANELIFTEYLSNRVRALNLTTKQVRTLLDGFVRGPAGIAVGPDNFLYVADGQGARILRMGPLPCFTTCVPEVLQLTGGTIRTPSGLAFNSSGQLAIADQGASKIWLVTGRAMALFAGSGSNPDDNIPATQARLFFPSGIAFDVDDSLLIADGRHNRIRRVRPDGIIVNVLGSGATSAGEPADGVTDPLLINVNIMRGVAVEPVSRAVFGSSPPDRRIYRVDFSGPTPLSTSVATPTPSESPTLTKTTTAVPTDTAPPTRTNTVPPATFTQPPTSTPDDTPTWTPTGTETATQALLPTSTFTATFLPSPTVAPLLVCDVTRNGNISSLDAAWVLQYVAGLRQFTDTERVLADATDNAQVSTLDAVAILQFVSGFGQSLPGYVPNLCGRFLSSS